MYHHPNAVQVSYMSVAITPIPVIIPTYVGEHTTFLFKDEPKNPAITNPDHVNNVIPKMVFGVNAE